MCKMMLVNCTNQSCLPSISLMLNFKEMSEANFMILCKVHLIFDNTFSRFYFRKAVR